MRKTILHLNACLSKKFRRHQQDIGEGSLGDGQRMMIALLLPHLIAHRALPMASAQLLQFWLPVVVGSSDVALLP
jgi:hypothetical protein